MFLHCRSLPSTLLPHILIPSLYRCARSAGPTPALVGVLCEEMREKAREKTLIRKEPDGECDARTHGLV